VALVPALTGRQPSALPFIVAAVALGAFTMLHPRWSRSQPPVEV